MAVAAWLVGRERVRRPVRGALVLFVAQLAANALWSWLFFFGRQGGVALAELVLLWLLIAATTVAFWRVRRLAAALLLPYLAWVAFAGVLNAVLWRTNPALLG
jgi:tryptophan-rich sensory protein